jgi:acetolactate synthase-1/2/3 large subunit
LATADPKGIEELADLLAGAAHPVIVTEDSGRTFKSVECLVEIAELLGCPVVETRSTGAINFPRTHALHSGYDPKEGVQGADVIFLLAVIAPWHPASITPSAGAKVAMLDENPLRAEIRTTAINRISASRVRSRLHWSICSRRSKKRSPRATLRAPGE